MAFVVIYDASVLHPSPLRDLLIRLANKRRLNLRARWTSVILEEMIDSVLNRRPDLDRARLERTADLMTRAVSDCLVTGWEPLVETLDLPDPDDRHVLAAAIRANAQAIVTANLKDFAAKALSRWDIEVQHPDVFLKHLIDVHPASVVSALTEQAAALRNPPQSAAQVVVTLRLCGLDMSAYALESLIA